MRKILLISCFLVSAALLTFAQQTVSLNGPWTFRTDPNDMGKKLNWPKTDLPLVKSNFTRYDHSAQ